MPHSSYNNIKKYAAFIFMVFTMLSGSSEVLDSDIDMLAAGRFYAHNARFSLSRAHIQSSIQNNEGLREFLDVNDIQGCILPLTILICSLNNIILKNNIWKNAVF